MLTSHEACPLNAVGSTRCWEKGRRRLVLGVLRRPRTSANYAWHA